MRLQFKHIFTGKRVWARKKQGNTPIQWLAVFGRQKVTIVGVAGSRRSAKQTLANTGAVFAGNADNTDTTATGRGRDSRNSIRIERLAGGVSGHHVASKRTKPPVQSGGYHVLLGNGQQVIDHPIEYESGREEQEEKGKNHRHPLHDFCLHGIRWRWIQFC